MGNYDLAKVFVRYFKSCSCLSGFSAAQLPDKALHYSARDSYPWWRHQIETFSALLALCAGNSPVPVNSQHKGQWRGALLFSFICAWIIGGVNNREAGDLDLRCHCVHYDVTLMQCLHVSNHCINGSWPNRNFDTIHISESNKTHGINTSFRGCAIYMVTK